MKPQRNIFILGSLLVIGALTAVFIIGFFQLAREAEQSSESIYDGFESAAEDLFRFNIGAAQSGFEEVNNDIASLTHKAQFYSILNLGGIAEFFKQLRVLGAGTVSITTSLQELSEKGFARFAGGEGELLIQNLAGLHAALKSVADASEHITFYAAQLGKQLGDEAVVRTVYLRQAEKFLESFLDWLRASGPQHLIIAFQNPSEIRPAGGFIGSYAHITVENGSMANIDVRDIYDPDGQLDLKLTPPAPLRRITPTWGARDANWFFDFPASAKKVLELLEASKIYQEQDIRFSGLVAVNVGVIEDILALLGPMRLPEYDATITAENFLEIVQREVEAGDDKRAGEPKRILKVLTPILFERLAALDEEAKGSITEQFANRIANKDIMLYFKDLAIESYLQVLGVGGEVMELPKGFQGDYLAVVNANIGGGKSDAFITQRIVWESEIDVAGDAHNTLRVTRAHGGEHESEWWYRATNKNYLQVFVPSSALASDAWGKEYAFGKLVLSAWLTTPAGEEDTITAKYTVPGAFRPEAGNVYTFVFEKQSGVEGSLEYRVQAPPGFYWRETQSSAAQGIIKNPPARVVLRMTLMREEAPR